MPSSPAVATWEREIMLERQREGIAKAAGKVQGPPEIAAVRIPAAPLQTARDAYW